MKKIYIEESSLYNSNKKVHNKMIKRMSGFGKVLPRGSVFNGTGHNLTGEVSYEGALHVAGIDYSAETVPLALESGYKLKNSFAVIRKDDDGTLHDKEEPLGVVGKQYKCVSNRDAFSVAEELVEEGFARYEIGGSIIGAQEKVDYSRAFLVLRGDDFKVADEPFNQFTILRNSFDGSSGVSFQVVCERVWCENMATRYLGGKKNQLRINIQHSRSAIERIEQAKQIVKKRNEDICLIQKEAEAFIGTPYTRQQFEKYVLPLLLKEMKLVEEGKDRERGQERIERVVQYALSAYDAEDTANWNGTAYKVILAIQDLESHMPALKDTKNPSLYLGRVEKGMLWTTAVAQMIASQANFDMKRFQN